MVLGVAAFPVAGLALLLWLTHLEETLPRDVRSAQRTSTPPPVLAVPVQGPETAAQVVRQESASAAPERSRRPRPAGAPLRPAEAAEVRTAAGQAFSRSTRLSLGGSTKR